MTDTYTPVLEAPPEGFDTMNIISLQETLEAEKLTHCQDTKGNVRKWLGHLNKKSIPVNTIDTDAERGHGAKRLTYKQVTSFGRMEADLPEATPEPPATDGHADRAHAILSASGAHRWLNCTPSALLEADLPDSNSDASLQGTAAHELAEHKVRRALKQRSDRPTSQWQDDEMEEHTDAYRDWLIGAAEKIPTAQIFIEQRLDFSHLVPGGYGTGDAIIIGDGTLHIVDFKYGAGKLVDAHDNPQMRLYAIGALNMFNVLYDIDEVIMTIYQPRRENYSTEILTVDELTKWGEQTVRPKAELAAAGEGEFSPGDWCGFCKLRNTCRARAEENLKVAQYEFAPPVELTDEEIADILAKAPQITKWLKDIETFASHEAIDQGRHWPGFKLVAGRATRKYTDPDEVARAAQAAGYTDIFDKKLLTITAMEKLMGKKEFGEVLGDLVHKPAGKPTLAPEADKRPAVPSNSAADAFGEPEAA